MKSIFFSNGIGDYLAVEPFVSNPETYGEVWLCTRSCREIADILRHIWPHVAIRVVERDWTRQIVCHAGQVPELPPDIEDWSMSVRIGPILRGELAYRQPSYRSVTRPSVHSRPVVVHPHTTADRLHERHVSEEEWADILAYLEWTGREAVVIGSEGYVPSHPLLHDARGLTSIMESLGLVNAAETFIGVDSWPSIVASKDLEKSMAVKTANLGFYPLRPLYYAPRTDVGFVADRIDTACLRHFSEYSRTGHCSRV